MTIGVLIEPLAVAFLAKKYSTGIMNTKNGYCISGKLSAYYHDSCYYSLCQNFIQKGNNESRNNRKIKVF